MSEPVKRRRRPPISCILCRKRKIKCDKALPCNHCVRSRTPAACQYDNPWSGPLGQSSTTQRTSQNSTEFPSIQAKDTASVGSHGSTLVESAPSTSVTSSPADVDVMQRRIKDLEDQLFKLSANKSPPKTTHHHSPSTHEPAPSPSTTNIETVSTGLSGAFHVQIEDPLFGETKISSRSVAHKTRVFGQSHWINGIVLFRDLAKEIEPLVKIENSKAVESLTRCKALARLTKSHRRPEWPTPPTPDLPSKELADELLDCYLRTFETVHRVIHLPSFREGYESLWYPDAKPDPALLVQVKLILAIGAETHDMTFSLRSSALRWIYEAQTWITNPNAKYRLNITTLQTQILLLMAKEMISNSGDSLWISAGSLIRTAMYMGLHRDPAQLPQQDTHNAEIRRRLWNTIIEMSLQASLTAGGAPLIDLEDFDTEPPGNFNDEDIALQDPTPKPEGESTQMSVAIALRHSFPLRLRIAKFLNDITSPATYSMALQLDNALRASYRTISKQLRDKPILAFALQYVDFLMNRYFIAIHMPFLERSLTSASCAYSRRTAVDAALKIWYITCPQVSSHKEDAGDMEKVVLCVSGFFKSVAVQALFILALETRSQIAEDEGLSPVPLRKDLLDALYEGKGWLLRCVEAGETNPKGFLFHCVALAQIEHLMKGTGKDGLPEALVHAAENAAEKSLAVMKKATEVLQADEGTEMEGFDLGNMDMGNMAMDNFDFMMTDTWLSGAGQMNWVFDETMPMW